MKRKGNELVNGSLVFIDNNLLPGSILTGPLPICRGFLENSFDNQSSTVRDKIQRFASVSDFIYSRCRACSRGDRVGPTDWSQWSRDFGKQFRFINDFYRKSTFLLTKYTYIVPISPIFRQNFHGHWS